MARSRPEPASRDGVEWIEGRPQRQGQGDDDPQRDDDQADERRPAQPLRTATTPRTGRGLGDRHRVERVCCIERGHDSLIRGSANAYRMSVTRLVSKKAMPPRMVTPMIA